MRIRKKLHVILTFALALAALAALGCGQSVTAAEPTPQVIALTSAPTATAAAAPTPVPAPQLKYIFLFIGDGMSTPQIQAAAEALSATGRDPLSFTDFPVVGAAHTNNAEGTVTDSAAAATAIASGTRSCGTARTISIR